MLELAMQWSIVDLLYERCKGTFHILLFLGGFFEITSCTMFVTELQNLGSRY